MATERNTTCKGFDGTLSFAKAPPLEEIIKLLKANCANWVFQRELGKDGYDHYQIRVRLLKKVRLTYLAKHNFLPTCHWDYTTTGTYVDRDFNYVMKEEGRKDGPWADKDPAVEQPTWQLREFLENALYPWQAKVEAMAKQRNGRVVDVILDLRGNSGKSIFAEYLAYRKVAVRVPPFRQMEDIMQNVMARPKFGAYLIDMPRGMKKDKLGELYSGIECIKNGWAWDKRYEYREVTFDRPRVFVFTNMLPDFSLLSGDRWNVWTISEDFDLVPERNSDSVGNNPEAPAKVSASAGATHPPACGASGSERSHHQP